MYDLCAPFNMGRFRLDRVCTKRPVYGRVPPYITEARTKVDNQDTEALLFIVNWIGHQAFLILPTNK
jgi:hypothetical protein